MGGLDGFRGPIMRGAAISFVFLLLVADLSSALPEGTPLDSKGSWGNSLDLEPNSRRDAMDGWMWPEAVTRDREGYTRVRRVYLDVALVAEGAGDLATPVSTTPSPSYRLFAYLGVWVDCNADGYMGSKATGGLVYPWSPLSDPTACPYSGDHIINDTVHELIWLAPNEDVGALASKVSLWADFGAPGEQPGSSITEDPLADPNAPKAAVDFAFRYTPAPAPELGMAPSPSRPGVCSPVTCQGWWGPVVEIRGPYVVIRTGDEPEVRIQRSRFSAVTAYASIGDADITKGLRAYPETRIGASLNLALVRPVGMHDARGLPS